MRTICFIVPVVLWLSVAVVLADETNAPPLTETRMAKPSPAFLLKNLDGLEVSSTNYAGMARIVWFWASWDKLCQKQLPALVELQRDYRTAGLRVLGLALDAKDPAALKAFCATNSVNFPVLIADYNVIQGFGGLEAIPTLFVIEPHGMIVGRYVGFTEKKTLETVVQSLLQHIELPK